MGLNVTPQTALNFTKASVYMVCSWPPSPSASRIQVIWFNLRWWIVLIFLTLLLIPLVNGVYVFRNDTFVMIKAACLCSATVQALIKLVICRVHRMRFQMLLTEMENFVRNTNSLEAKYIKSYIEKTADFHVFVTTSIFIVCLYFIIEPILLLQPFPTDVSYPFPVNNGMIHMILYIQQCIALFFIAAALSIDCQVATLLWFTSARFEIVGNQFEKASTDDELALCIKHHQELLCYANEVHNAIRYIVFGTIATTTIGVICGCLILISTQPFSVKFRMGNIVGNAASELFIYSWPADNLIRVVFFFLLKYLMTTRRKISIPTAMVFAMATTMVIVMADAMVVFIKNLPFPIAESISTNFAMAECSMAGLRIFCHSKSAIEHSAMPKFVGGDSIMGKGKFLMKAAMATAIADGMEIFICVILLIHPIQILTYIDMLEPVRAKLLETEYLIVIGLENLLFLSRTFSYFTTLRIILSSKDT